MRLYDLFRRKPSERRKAERHSSSNLAALHWDDNTQKSCAIRNISLTGVYLLTQERFPIGQPVSLTLQHMEQPDNSPAHRIAPLAKTARLSRGPEHPVTLQANAIRWDDNGVGLSWVLPIAVQTCPSENQSRRALGAQEPKDILVEFQRAQAIAFLRRICPADAEIGSSLFNGNLSSLRVAHALEIVLDAESRIKSEQDGDDKTAVADIVVRILQDGSWSEDGELRKLWSGILATACTAAGNDKSNLVFVNLLSQLRPVHARLLGAAFARATNAPSDSRSNSSRSASFSAAELIRISGLHDVVGVEREIGFLCDLGLITEPRSTSFSRGDRIDITPTSLGLRMYSRCSGHFESPSLLQDEVSRNS